MKLLMISTDRKIFEKNSPVALRQIALAKNMEELHIVVFEKFSSQSSNIKFGKSSEKIEGVSGIRISPNCFVYSTQSRLKLMYPRNAIKIGQSIVKKNGITNITCQDAILTAMVGVALKNKFHIPLEIQIHNDLGSPYFTYNISNRIRKFLAKRYMRRADSIRVVSKRINEYLVKYLKIQESRIEIRPIAVDVESIRNASISANADLHKKYPQFSKIVLMASRLESEKNVEMAIKAWKYVMSEMPKAGLVIVGEGSQKERLQRLVSNIYDWTGSETVSIRFESWADQNTLISYYKTADLFLNTSLFEGYGMTLVEASAAGCKVISTDVGVAREIGATIVGLDSHSIARAVIESVR